MTKIYDKYTKMEITLNPLRIAGFAINKGDILNIGGKKYKISEIEYDLEENNSNLTLKERKIYVLKENNNIH